jgi:HlyD family secretion protein
MQPYDPGGRPSREAVRPGSVRELPAFTSRPIVRSRPHRVSDRTGKGFSIVRRTPAILLAIAILSCNRSGKKNEQYKTEKADRGAITMTVTATGTLSAVTTVQVGSQVSGVISRLYADFNSKVQKGQLLAELDPTPFQAQVEQRMADLSKAQIEAANSKIGYERQARLLRAGLAAQADVDNSKAQYESAGAQVRQASAALSQAQTNLHYTRILSPIDGTVVDRQYDVGQTVAASFQAPTLFSIAQDLKKMQVQADVDQSDIGRVQVGQAVQFSVDAYPDQTFQGRISQMRLNATVAQNVVTYPVIIEVPNPDEKLRPKMTANVTIAVAQVQDVLRISNSALRFKPEGAAATPAGGRNAQTADGNASTSTATSSGGAGGGAASGAGGGGGANGAGGGRSGGRRRNGGAGGFGGGTPEGAAAQMGERGAGITGAGAAFGPRGGGRKQGQNIYILDADKKPKAVWIRTGITDGHYTQVVGGDLKEGDMVIVGLVTAKVEGPAAPGTNQGPFGRPGGGGGGRGR